MPQSCVCPHKAYMQMFYSNIQRIRNILFELLSYSLHKKIHIHSKVDGCNMGCIARVPHLENKSTDNPYIALTLTRCCKEVVGESGFCTYHKKLQGKLMLHMMYPNVTRSPSDNLMFLVYLVTNHHTTLISDIRNVSAQLLTLLQETLSLIDVNDICDICRPYILSNRRNVSTIQDIPHVQNEGVFKRARTESSNIVADVSLSPERMLDEDDQKRGKKRGRE